MHTYIHANSNATNHYSTYIRTFGALRRFNPAVDRAGSTRRFGFVSLFPSMTCAQTGLSALPDNSLLTAPPHIEAAPRDDGAEVGGALAAESICNSGFSGAAAEKHDASEGQNAPSPDGPGRLKTIVFVCVCVCVRAGDIKQQSRSMFFLQSIGSAFYESAPCLDGGAHFRTRF